MMSIGVFSVNFKSSQNLLIGSTVASGSNLSEADSVYFAFFFAILYLFSSKSVLRNCSSFMFEICWRFSRHFSIFFLKFALKLSLNGRV